MISVLAVTQFWCASMLQVQVRNRWCVHHPKDTSEHVADINAYLDCISLESKMERYADADGRSYRL